MLKLRQSNEKRKKVKRKQKTIKQFLKLKNFVKMMYIFYCKKKTKQIKKQLKKPQHDANINNGSQTLKYKYICMNINILFS